MYCLLDSGESGSISIVPVVFCYYYSYKDSEVADFVWLKLIINVACTVKLYFLSLLMFFRTVCNSSRKYCVGFCITTKQLSRFKTKSYSFVR